MNNEKQLSKFETIDQSKTITSAAVNTKDETKHQAKQATSFKRRQPVPRGQAKRHRETEYQLSDLPQSLSLSPRKQYYSIYTGSASLPDIADAAFTVMQSRVKTLGDVISKELFKYIVAISWYARLVDININLSTAYPTGANLLREASKGIELPLVICKYVEALGFYKMHNGAKLVPYVSSYRELIPIGSEWYYDPLEAIEEARRPDPENEWSIDFNWISDYTLNVVPKMMRSGIELRRILPGLEGRAELVIGYEPAEDNFVKPMAPEKQTLAAAQLGAAYRYRNYAEQDDWPHGDNLMLTPLFTGEAMSPELVIATAMQESLRAIN